MNRPIVKIRPKWYLYWSPKAWKLSKAQESILNWWLSKPENEANIVWMMFDQLASGIEIPWGSDDLGMDKE